MTLELELLVAAWDNYKKNVLVDWSSVAQTVDNSINSLVDAEERDA